MMKRYPTVAADLESMMQARQEDTELKLGRTHNLVAVYSTSDRCGKTALLCNLGVYLRSVMFLETTLIDANLQFGDLGYIFHLPTEKNLATLAESRQPVSNETLAQCMEVHETGLKILPAPLKWENVELVEPDLLEEVIHWLKRENDFVLVECAPKLDAVTLKVLDMATKILILVTPDYISVKNTRRVLGLFQDRLEYPEEKLIIGLNNLYPEHFRKAAVKKLLDRKKFDFELPTDPGKFLGLFKDSEFEVLKNDQSDYSKAIAKIAKNVLEAKPRGEQPKSSTFLGKLFKKN
jgi:pilus assembly protein CpaE